MGNSFASKSKSSKREEHQQVSSNESLPTINSKSKSKKHRKKKSVKGSDDVNSQTSVKKKLSFSKKLQERPSKKKKKRSQVADDPDIFTDTVMDKNNQNQFPRIVISSPSDVEASLENEVSLNTESLSDKQPASESVVTESSPVEKNAVANGDKSPIKVDDNEQCQNPSETSSSDNIVAVESNQTVISTENHVEELINNQAKTSPTLSEKKRHRGSKSSTSSRKNLETQNSNSSNNVVPSAPVDLNRLKSNLADASAPIDLQLPSLEQNIDSEIRVVVNDIIEKTVDTEQCIDIKDNNTENTETENSQNAERSAAEPNEDTIVTNNSVRCEKSSESTSKIATVTDAPILGVRSDLDTPENMTVFVEEVVAKADKPLETIRMPNNHVIYLEEISKADQLVASPNPSLNNNVNEINKDINTDIKTIEHKVRMKRE